MFGKVVRFAVGAFILLALAVAPSCAAPIYAEAERGYRMSIPERVDSAAPMLDGGVPSSWVQLTAQSHGKLQAARSGFFVPDLPVPEPSTLLLLFFPAVFTLRSAIRH